MLPVNAGIMSAASPLTQPPCADLHLTPSWLMVSAVLHIHNDMLPVDDVIVAIKTW
jgi:hypothetical protein